MNLVTTERTPSSADRPRAVLPPARAYCRKHAFAPFSPNVSPGTQVQGCSPSSRHVSYDLPPSLAVERSVGRYYDPATGQFLSVDPAVQQTLEAYVYVGDDPVNGTDPGGERGVPRNAVKLFCNLGLSIALCLPTVNQGYDRNPQPTHMPESSAPAPKQVPEDQKEDLGPSKYGYTGPWRWYNPRTDGPPSAELGPAMTQPYQAVQTPFGIAWTPVDTRAVGGFALLGAFVALVVGIARLITQACDSGACAA